MNDVLISTNERYCRRFEDLCERLDAKTQEEIDRVFFHLMAWYLRWAADKETDSGLLWNISESRLGMWAEHGRPVVFGRALREAGYVKAVSEVYVEPLLNGRSGFVVVGALDKAWDGVHRHRTAEAGLLCRYLLDRTKRVSYCARYGVRPDEVPPGWLDPFPGEPPQHVAHTCDVRGSPAAPPLPPREHVQVNLENKHIQQREGSRHTGTPKTAQLRDLIDQWKYEDPRQCLHAIDPSRGAAAHTWDRAIQVDKGFVCQVLAELVETDAAWLTVPDPPARLVMPRLIGMLRANKKRGGTWQSRGGSGGADKVIQMPGRAVG